MPINTSNADFGEQIITFLIRAIHSADVDRNDSSDPGRLELYRTPSRLGRQRDAPGRDACRRESEAGRLVLSDESV
jgi:hypothetical protein